MVNLTRSKRSHKKHSGGKYKGFEFIVGGNLTKLQLFDENKAGTERQNQSAKLMFLH